MNLTNQQLAFARLQVKAAEVAQSTLSRRAHWQAGVWQLNLALECYARELLEQVKAKAVLRSGPQMFTRLSSDIRAQDKICVEADELARLEREPESWLSKLQCWSQNLPNLGLPERGRSLLDETSLTEQEKSDSNTITLVEVASGSNPQAFTGTLLREAIDQAAALIETQRQNSAEY